MPADETIRGEEMAQVSQVVLTCDVHEGDAEAADTVTFTVEGKSYECELCEPHLAEFHEAMEVWSSHSRPARAARASQGASSRAPRRRTGTNGAPSASVVREWARSQGLEVSSRGRVPAELLVAFEAAH